MDTSLLFNENSGTTVNTGVLWQWNAGKEGTPGWEISDHSLRVSDADWHKELVPFLEGSRSGTDTARDHSAGKIYDLLL